MGGQLRRVRGGRWTRRTATPRAPVAPSSLVATVLLLAATPVVAANQVRITKLSDAAFGTVSNLTISHTVAENVCVFSNTATKGYGVKATGSGASGAFTLSAGASTLTYLVEWNSSSGQTTGATLTSGVNLTGLTGTATQQACSSGPATSASLIVILPASSLGSATAGSYSGTLTLLVTPE